MGLSYFDGKTWGEITREERVFCAELYQVIRAHPRGFVRFLNFATPLTLNAEVFWDVGYEVCFYRDILDHRGAAKRASGFSLKRTFDLCLFSEDVIVVIEAKAHQLFTAEQGKSFAEDARAIERLIGSHPNVHLVALASSRYFSAFDAHGRGAALESFSARLTWKQLQSEYQLPLFDRAESIYRPERIADPAGGATPDMCSPSA